MKRFVVSEVWIRQYVVEAESEEAALDEGPWPLQTGPALSLCNWHAIDVTPRDAEGAATAQEVA